VDLVVEAVAAGALAKLPEPGGWLALPTSSARSSRSGADPEALGRNGR
jgi:hypothetical protein